MHDEIVSDNLIMILESIELVEKRFSGIDEADNFVSSENGIMILDSIAMRLQVIGELTKKIDKVDTNLLSCYPGIEWDKIMKMRDLISHHYESVDHEIIFDICKKHIPMLKIAIERLIQNASTPENNSE